MEVKDQVTRVLTDALAGVPGATAMRGQSMSGMAYLDVIFGSTSEVAPGRADIAARIDKVRARLPATVRVQVGPEASSTGWIYQYALLPPDTKKGMTMGARRPDKAATSMFGLRRFQDEVLRPRLAAIPGVAEVASLGGDKEELLDRDHARSARRGGRRLFRPGRRDPRRDRRSRGRPSSRSGRRRSASSHDARARCGGGRRSRRAHQPRRHGERRRRRWRAAWPTSTARAPGRRRHRDRQARRERRGGAQAGPRRHRAANARSLPRAPSWASSTIAPSSASASSRRFTARSARRSWSSRSWCSCSCFHLRSALHPAADAAPHRSADVRGDAASWACPRRS